MALPLLPAIIAGGAALAGSVTSSLSARATQKRQQKQDEKFWHMQNEYNNPQNQMRRLQTAGLNPNLVYGQSSGQAAGQAERIKTPDLDPAAHRFINPEGATQMLGQYFDYDVKQAQSDNLKAQTQVAQENAILTAQKSYGEGVRNARTLFDLHMAEDLKQNSLDYAKTQLKKLKADAQYTVNQDERASIALANNTAEAVERILTARTGRELTKAQTENVRTDLDLKKLDQRLATMGIRPSDPFYATAIMRLLTEKGWLRMAESYSKKAADPFGILK